MEVVTHLLDTNALIQILRGRGKSIVKHLLDHPPGSVAVCSISLGELAFGARLVDGEDEAFRVARLMKDFFPAPFGEREAWEYGKIRSELHRAGTPIGQLDMQIAAVARCRRWVVVTHNTAEFERVEGLEVEDWQET